MKIAREFWAYPVPPKHGAVSAYTHKELCPDPNPIHLREVLPDDTQDLDELEKELLDKLYHATREVDEVKYLLGHKIEVLVIAIKESISRSDDSGDSYNSQPIREVLTKIENNFIGSWK